MYFSEFTKAVREGKYDQAIKVSDSQRGSAAAVLKAETFDVESLAQRGFGNEALDQLVVDHILGIA